MNILGAQRTDAATPVMLFLSVSLHLVVILLVFMVSLSPVDRTTTYEEGVTHVSLIEAPAAKPLLETISRGPVKMHHPAEPEPLLQQELPAVPAEAEQKTISYELPSQHDSPVIPLKKRKASPRRIETIKPDTAKKHDTKAAEKRDEPKDFLEKRLSQIRAEVQKKRKEQSVSRQASAPAGGPIGGGSTSAAVSEDFIRWFDDVRGRINSHWSILGDNRKMEKIAVIGVKLSDDGRLIDAAVDETSGDPMFDKSAMRAVFLASPFPPVPPEIREKIKQSGGLALRFSPGGMQ